jgi:hypothetical protein
MNGLNFLWAPEDMTVEELDRRYNRLLLRFYLRPAALRLFARMSWQYPNHLLRTMRFGFALLWAKLRSWGREPGR